MQSSGWYSTPFPIIILHNTKLSTPINFMASNRITMLSLGNNVMV